VPHQIRDSSLCVGIIYINERFLLSPKIWDWIFVSDHDFKMSPTAPQKPVVSLAKTTNLHLITINDVNRLQRQTLGIRSLLLSGQHWQQPVQQFFRGSAISGKFATVQTCY
jgi:hypothetical protein